MIEQHYEYAIIGGGLAAAHAVEGIRAHDTDGSIVLVAREPYLPYERPLLSKKLWTGQKQLPDIYPHDRSCYESMGVQLLLGQNVASLDVQRKMLTLADGEEVGFGKLLLATGGQPRRLPVPGGELEGVSYFRYLSDYLRLRGEAQEGSRAVVIGGGFIGSELAAALTLNKVEVTMLFPEQHLCARVFPAGLARAIDALYEARGIRLLAGDTAVAIGQQQGRYTVRTGSGQTLAADIVVAGIGIVPDVGLAQASGLAVSDGIDVDGQLCTSSPSVWAAGDVARFPYVALGERRRVEHWDNAVTMGHCAGENMAGAGRVYDHMPYFYSDLFEFGYEAVGDIDSRLDTFADWKQENDTGAIYYLKDGKVRGVMMCNLWDKVPLARELIRHGKAVAPADLRGAIA